jgi:glycosyltransferase involved in cell wall biosynthesis
MKILLLSTFETFGGAAVACRRLMQALNKSDNNVWMYVQEKKSGTSHVISNEGKISKFLSKFRFVIERVFFLFYEKNKSVRFQFSPAIVGLSLNRNTIFQKADVIHLHWTQFGFLSIKSLEEIFQSNKPVVITLHDMWYFTGGCHYSRACDNYERSCGNCEQFLSTPSSNDLSHKLWLKKQKLFNQYKNNIQVVACSQWLASIAQTSSIFRGYKIHAIPNPIDIELFKPTTFENQNKKIILFAAMKISDERKGWTYLLEALNYLSFSIEFNNVELLIMGHVDEKDLKNIPFNYTCTGYLSNVTQIIETYQKATVFAMPSLEDNLPNTIMEAMACGTPSVGFNQGGIPEMITHLKNGYVADYKSSEDFANGLKYVLTSNDLSDLRKKARNKVELHYSEEIVAQQYKAIYQLFK